MQTLDDDHEHSVAATSAVLLTDEVKRLYRRVSCRDRLMVHLPLSDVFRVTPVLLLVGLGDAATTEPSRHSGSSGFSFKKRSHD
jgi:hypothetical protein